MDTALLDVLEAKARGYRPLVDFATWRVAVLGFEDDLRPDRIRTMERHTETDEVFLLVTGQAVLLLAGNRSRPDGIEPVVMDSATVYNVRRGTWHGILVSRDAAVLLVENVDTGRRNTELADLVPNCRERLQEIARREFVS
jgi:ureidoglycolate hydrolase